MCVYKGVTGLVKKLTPQAGTRWPEYFGIKPKPIWCGETVLEVEDYLKILDPVCSAGEFRFGSKSGVTWQATCAAAWAQYHAMDWFDYFSPGCGVDLTEWCWGPGDYKCEAVGMRMWIEPKIEEWWAAYPDLQPTRMLYHARVDDPGPDDGGVWVPDYYAYERLDSSTVELEFDVSGVSFPPAGWKFQIEPYSGMEPFCCDPGGWSCNKSARIDTGDGQYIEIWGGEAGWEYIDIPNWIFDSPGKYWLAMVDAEGVMLPGPYLPLN